MVFFVGERLPAEDLAVVFEANVFLAAVFLEEAPFLAGAPFLPAAVFLTGAALLPATLLVTAFLAALFFAGAAFLPAAFFAAAAFTGTDLRGLADRFDAVFLADADRFAPDRPATLEALFALEALFTLRPLPVFVAVEEDPEWPLASASSAVAELRSLLKLLFSPAAVSSW